MEGLHAGYGGVPIVRDLCLTVGAGEVVALLGPNGAGKTTTRLTLSGLLAPIAGRIEVLGSSIGGVRPHLLPRRGLAHVPEDRSLFYDLTVERLLPIEGDIADQTGCGVLIVEQHVHMALDIADRGCVLSSGTVRLEGSARDLASNRSLLEETYLG